MDLRKIQFFFAVVEHRNLSGAAQFLRVSQPTLTRHMQALETDFGTPLFIRGGRGMLLTEAGMRLHEGLKGVERQIRSLRNDVAATMVEPSGEIAFGIPPSPRVLLGTPLIRRYAKTYPRTNVRVVEETSGGLRDLVASGVLDLSMTNAAEPLSGVIAEALGREAMVLVGPGRAKLSMKTETPFEDIADLPLILTTRPNSLRLMVETGLGKFGLRPIVKCEANTMPLITDLVRAGLGYTVLPLCGVRALLKEKLVSASPISGCFVTWLVAKPRNRSLGTAAERFYQMLCETSRDLVRDGIWGPPSS
jgi:LysR family nitrogen assimilation transcriptional regulator